MPRREANPSTPAGVAGLNPVAVREVAPDDAGIRLDRWFSRHFPGITHGKLEKLLRTGQIRLDGARAKAGSRLETGQKLRLPPLPADALAKTLTKSPPPTAAKSDLEAIVHWVIHRDDDVLVIDKPAGLAVQGGSGQTRYLDAMLDGLRFGAARPRLVHRIDKDTSGVLVLGRTAAAAAALAAAFKTRAARKLYWALVVGVPYPAVGKIDASLAKMTGPGGERMMTDDDDGKPAVTLYQVLDHAAKRAAWLKLQPLTGRTHQLRAHCAMMGTPIVGDGKYGGKAAFIGGSVSRKLHLHARAIEMPHPAGGTLRALAPPPPHIAESLKFLGFENSEADGFLD